MSPTTLPPSPGRSISADGVLEPDRSGTPVAHWSARAGYCVSPAEPPRPRTCSRGEKDALSDTGTLLPRSASAPDTLTLETRPSSPVALPRRPSPIGSESPPERALSQAARASSPAASPTENRFLSSLSWIQAAAARLDHLRSRLVSAEAEARRMGIDLADLETSSARSSRSSGNVQSLLDSSELFLAQQALRILLFKNIDPVFGTLPCSGLIPPSRFQPVFVSLAQALHHNLFPKTLVGIGSGEGFLEKCFETIGCQVSCYDRQPCNKYTSVQQADFPADSARCLPEDCSDCLLLAAYPQGQLGPVLAEFIRRGGQRLCTTVEESLFTQMHEDYEKDPSILRQGIKTLAEKKSGECFEVELRPYRLGSGPVMIQFYNFPSSVRQLLLESPELKDCCSDIFLDFDRL